MLAALRRALPLVPRPTDSLYDSLVKNWDDVLDGALRDDELLECVFPAGVFAESLWHATNANSPTAEQDAAALAEFLREWITTDLNLYRRWSQDQVLHFARRALPLYQQVFANDLANEGGALYQAFTVKGINEIRAFAALTVPRLQQLVHEQQTDFAKITGVLRDQPVSGGIRGNHFRRDKRVPGAA
jgi:hypothetical protein